MLYFRCTVLESAWKSHAPLDAAQDAGWMLTSGSWAPGPESRIEPSPRSDRRLRRGGWRRRCGDWNRGTLLGYGKECRMATTSSSLVSGAGAPPIRVGIARVADRPSGGCVALGGSGVVGAGLDSMH